MKNHSVIGVLAATMFVLLCSLSQFCTAQNTDESAPKTERQIVLKGMSAYNKKVHEVYAGLGSSSRGDGLSDKLMQLDKEMLIPLGTQSLTYMLPVEQVFYNIGGGIYGISKFEPHNIELVRKPKNLLSTTEEFPELQEKDIDWSPEKIWLQWWLEGKERTPKWFAERYAKWQELRAQNKLNEAKTQYQKLLDIGVPAIPLWLEKLNAKPDAPAQQAIGEALSYLTDGAVKADLAPAEYSRWWQENHEKWTIPFPQNRQSFIQWLEQEANEPDGLGVACAVTLSRIKDKAALDVLVRLLKHPDSEYARKVSNSCKSSWASNCLKITVWELAPTPGKTSAICRT